MNFYEEILMEIKELIKKKNYDEASKIIQQELSMPYVPVDVEITLLQLKKEIIDITDTLIKISGAQTLGIDQIRNLLNNENDSIGQTIAINNLEKINVRMVLEDIKQYLMNANMSSQNKTFLLFSLMKQEIDFEFLVIKNNKEYKINPIELDMTKADNEIQKITEIIDKSIGQENPSIAEIGKTTLFFYFFYNFPEVNLEKENEVAAAIITLAHEMCGLEFKLDEVSIWFKFNFDEAKEMIRLITESGALKNGSD